MFDNAKSQNDIDSFTKSFSKDISWFDLPVEFVKNAQSTQLISHYIKVNINSQGKMLELTENNQPQAGLKNLQQTLIEYMNEIMNTHDDDKIARMISEFEQEKIKRLIADIKLTDWEGIQNTPGALKK